MRIHFEIQDELRDARLDKVLSSMIEGCSRGRAAVSVNNGDVLVRGLKKKPGYRVRKGDVITGEIRENKGFIPLAQAIDLSIVFEDSHIIVLNKDSGMVVHPGAGNFTGTLVNALLFHNPDLGKVGKEKLRSGIVHRLDKDTSGLMVVAKTDFALEFLQKEFRQRRVEKKYLALVSGRELDAGGEIILPIGRHTVKKNLMSVNPEKGKYAKTCWRVLKRFDKACLVRVLLKTGRTHQIRVHFYAIDHPLIGEKIYQYRRKRRQNGPVPRQMLHSAQLGFRHPYSGRGMSFKAEPPQDFLNTIAMLEQSCESHKV